MTLFSLAEIKQRNEERRRNYKASESSWDDIDALIAEIERLRSIRLPSGNER